MMQRDSRWRRGLAAGLWMATALAAACATPASEGTSYPHEAEPIGTVREIYDGVLSPELAVNTFRNIHRLFATRSIPPSTAPRPLPVSDRPLVNVEFSDDTARYALEQYLEANRVTALLVLHDGRIVAEQYRHGNTERTRWMSMSIAKSVTSTLFGAALRDGHIASLDDPVTRYVPTLAGSVYDGVSVRQVLRMSSGVQWTETYTNPASDRRRLLEAQIAQQPGGAMSVMRGLARQAPPGSVNTYSTGETQVAAEILRGALGRDLSAYLSEQVWEPMGMESEATWWLESPGGIEIGGSGFSATLRDYGRLGQFILDGGVIGADSVLPAGWVTEATTPYVLPDGRRVDYGYFWWVGTSEAARRDGAFSGEGIHGQSLYVNPAARVVIVVWSAQPRPTGGAVADDWSFFEAVVDSLRARRPPNELRAAARTAVPPARARTPPRPTPARPAVQPSTGSAGR